MPFVPDTFSRLLWWTLSGTSDFEQRDTVSSLIAYRAGVGVLDGVSTHLLVATHVFLEMLHYGVWIFAMPLIGKGTAPWNLSGTPLGRLSPAWEKVLVAMFIGGGLIVLALWAGFIADYPITYHIYFTVAIVHVLAEFPFLIRLH